MRQTVPLAGVLGPMLIGLTLFWVWMPVSHIMRVTAVSRTYRRYVANTWEKLTRYPALTFVVVPWVPLVYVGEVMWYMRVACGISSLACVAVWYWCWRMARAEDRPDDDDWFSKTSFRVRSWWLSTRGIRRLGVSHG